MHETKRCEMWEWRITWFLFETTSESRLPTLHNSFTWNLEMSLWRCIKNFISSFRDVTLFQNSFHVFPRESMPWCVPFLFKLRLKRTTQLRDATSAGTPGTAALEHPVQCRSLWRLWLARPSPWILDETANSKLLDVAWGNCEVLEVAKSCHVLLHPGRLAALWPWQDFRIPTAQMNVPQMDGFNSLWHLYSGLPRFLGNDMFLLLFSKDSPQQNTLRQSFTRTLEVMG